MDRLPTALTPSDYKLVTSLADPTHPLVMLAREHMSPSDLRGTVGLLRDLMKSFTDSGCLSPERGSIMDAISSDLLDDLTVLGLPYLFAQKYQRVMDAAEDIVRIRDAFRDEPRKWMFRGRVVPSASVFFGFSSEHDMIRARLFMG